MPKRALGAVILAGVLATSGAGFAQSNPSANSIINSLTPHAGMMGTTRGIGPLRPPAATAEPAAPVAAHPGGRIAPHPATPAASPGTAAPRAPAAATATADAPSVNLTVQFANDSAKLTPAAMRTLDELGRALSSSALASFRFRIEGHTDSLGAADHNQQLSEMRARAVVDYLVAKFHVDAARLEPIGMGETHPLIQTDRNVAEPRNRRVTVVNVGA